MADKLENTTKRIISNFKTKRRNVILITTEINDPANDDPCELIEKSLVYTRVQGGREAGEV